MNQPNYAERVASAAALLDERAGNWWSRSGGFDGEQNLPLRSISLDILDTEFAEHCALGQMYGEFDNAPRALRQHPGFVSLIFYPPDADLDALIAIDDARGVEYAGLTEAWRDVIQARRGATAGA